MSRPPCWSALARSRAQAALGGGTDLSGGRWLRLRVARGIVPEAELLAMDEPPAAIGPWDAAARRRCSSHRLGVPRTADRSIVLDQGREVEEGPHEQLPSRDGVHARMWRAAPAPPGRRCAARRRMRRDAARARSGRTPVRWTAAATPFGSGGRRRSPA